jgi:hypothetical protein
MGLISDAFAEPMMKILIAASVLSILIEYNDTGLKGGGWLDGASILYTYLAVTIVSSISAYNC